MAATYLAVRKFWRSHFTTHSFPLGTLPTVYQYVRRGLLTFLIPPYFSALGTESAELCPTFMIASDSFKRRTKIKTRVK